MHFAQTLVFAVLYLTVAFAAPTRPHRKSFKVERVRRADYVPNGPVAMRKAFLKFGFLGLDSPDHVATASQSTSTSAAANSSSGSSEEGEVTASPVQNDAEFLSPVAVGGQTLVMDFDTGSSDMWVFDSQLSSAEQQGHTIYNPQDSSTFKELTGSTFNISYGDGSFAQGTVGIETVNIGGATATQQAIGLATTVAASFVSDTASNGLVGLAFSKLNTVKPQQQKTFFENVQASLEQPVFTANLKHGVAGAYEFGAIDDSQFQGQLSNTPVDSSQGFWQFASAQFAVGSGAPQTASGGSGIAIADTGTSLMLVDAPVAKAYYSQVQGAQLSTQVGGFIFPCSTSLPNFSVAVGSTMATVPGSLINFASAGEDPTTGEQYCFGGVQSNEGNPFQIYGDVFFKAQFVAFDGSGPSIGVAPHA